MRRTPETGAPLFKNPEERAPGQGAFRISEPDGEGNRFIVPLQSDGRDDAQSSDGPGRFDKEGA